MKERETMRTIWPICRTELRTVLREPGSLAWMFVPPVAYALFFGAVLGGGGELRAAEVDVIANTDSAFAQAYVRALERSEVLEVDTAESRRAAAGDVQSGRIDAFVVLDDEFAGRFVPSPSGSRPTIEVGADPSKSAVQGLLGSTVVDAYFRVMRRWLRTPGRARELIDREIRTLESTDDVDPAWGRWLSKSPVYELSDEADVGAAMTLRPRVEVRGVRSEGASETRYRVTFPQAVLWGLIFVSTRFAPSMAQERRDGTFLRFRAAPVGLGTVVAGKALAILIACTGVASAVFLLGSVFPGVDYASVPGLGLATLATASLFAGTTMFAGSLGESPGMVSSILTVLLLVLVMFGGGMIPLELMPAWTSTVSLVDPLRWAMFALEAAAWRDLPFEEYGPSIGVVAATGVALLVAAAAVLRYRLRVRG